MANNETDTSTLYNGVGQPFPPASPLVVSVPGGPTGVVFNGGSQFAVPVGGGMAPARFVFATAARSSAGPEARRRCSGRTGRASAPRTSASRSRAIGCMPPTSTTGGSRSSTGRSTSLTPAGSFRDPKLPGGYAPFGIQAIGGHIFVAYAKQDAAGEDEVTGRGLGAVDEYDANGMLIARVERHAKLNAPWGMAMAPASGFGPLSGSLIVGNFGDGRLNGFKKDASGQWQHVDQLRGTNGLAAEIEGLWDRLRERRQRRADRLPVLRGRYRRRGARPLRRDSRRELERRP